MSGSKIKKAKKLARREPRQALRNSGDVSLNTIRLLLDSGKIHSGTPGGDPQHRKNDCEIVKENLRAPFEHLRMQAAHFPLTADSILSVT
jgi:hypothetical protein